MLEVNGALEGIFLGCFLFGLLLVLGSLALGAVDIGHDFGGSDIGGHDVGDHGPLGPLSFTAILTFLAVFGAVGYLASNAAGLIAIVSLALALAAGLAAGAGMNWIIKKLKSSAAVMDPRDYRLPGTLARVTSSIRAGGVGEIIYEQQGVRQVSAARSHDGRAIARGTEVIILDKVGGFALVQAFDEALEVERSRPKEPERVQLT